MAAADRTAGGELSATLVGKHAEWIANLRYEDLPPATIDMAKLCIIDFLGLALKGSTLPQVKPVFALLDALGARPECSVAGTDVRTTLPYAAFANATFGHSCEYDDSHIDCGHPGVCVIPSLLAFAERDGLSGADFLTAMVAGYQTMSIVTGPIHGQMVKLGWHGTKVAGPFGAAAAIGKALGMPAIQIANALAVSASDASGTTEYDQSGGEVKRFHAGLAARSGVVAALLAQAGLTGPLTILEGPRGITTLFSAGAPPIAKDFWDGEFHMLRTMFKLYPAAGTLHAALDALRAIQARTPFEPDDIETIEVGLIDWGLLHGAAIVHPVDAISAQFSLGFSLGLRLTTGASEMDDYMSKARWDDPAILAVSRKVRPFAMPMPAGACPLFADVTVRLKDGRSDHEFQGAPRGHPENPPTRQDIEDKFHSVVRGLLDPDAANALVATVHDLENKANVADLMAPLLRRA